MSQSDCNPWYYKGDNFKQEFLDLLGLLWCCLYHGKMVLVLKGICGNWSQIEALYSTQAAACWDTAHSKEVFICVLRQGCNLVGLGYHCVTHLTRFVCTCMCTYTHGMCAYTHGMCAESRGQPARSALRCPSVRVCHWLAGDSLCSQTALFLQGSS